MNPSDTIAAVASGAGPSARAIIRMSGPGTRAVLERVLVGAPGAAGAHRSRLRLDPADRGLDLPCMVIRFDGPRSYTGQDAAEVQLPGNPALVERVMRIALGGPEGVRQAEPGEFTARAFLAGKLSLDRAEGVQALIAARTDAQRGAAARLLHGELGDACRGIADELTTLLALVEAGIDFSDQEDVVAIDPAALRERSTAVMARIDRLAGPESAREAERAAPVVVIAGPPNTGKSTLFNALLGRARAMVSAEAGSTRDALRETLVLEEAAGAAPGERAPAVALVDLAGLDAALERRSAADRAAQRAARRALDSADVVVLCRPTGGAGLDEDALALGARPVIRVRTKADLPRVAGDSAAIDPLAVCALDGWNLGPLRRAIADAAFGAGSVGSDHWVLPRHRRALSTARRALEGLADGAEELGRPELAAAALRTALDEVGSIVGAVTPDDVIGRVFATFCVGK